MKRPFTCLAVLDLAFALTGCGGPGSVVQSFKQGDVTTTPHVAFFAQASAGQMFSAGFEPAWYFGHYLVPDRTCPKVTDDGTTLRIVGNGCTDPGGQTTFGTLTFVRSGGSLLVGKADTQSKLPFGTATFDGFGQSTNTLCSNYGSITGTTAPKTTGTASISSDGAHRARFTVDLRTDEAHTPTSCPPTPLTTAAEYQGTLSVTGNGEVSLAGSGTFGTSFDGKVSATTTDEVFDSTGGANGLQSGTTTLRAGGHVAVITYHPVRYSGDFFSSGSTWALDGKDEGVVPRATCATMPGRGGMPGVLSVLTVLGLVALRRRRRP